MWCAGKLNALAAPPLRETPPPLGQQIHKRVREAFNAKLVRTPLPSVRSESVMTRSGPGAVISFAEALPCGFSHEAPAEWHATSFRDGGPVQRRLYQMPFCAFGQPYFLRSADDGRSVLLASDGMTTIAEVSAQGVVGLPLSEMVSLSAVLDYTIYHLLGMERTPSARVYTVPLPS